MALGLMVEILEQKISLPKLLAYCAEFQDHLRKCPPLDDSMSKAQSFHGYERTPPMDGGVRPQVKPNSEVVTVMKHSSLRHYIDITPQIPAGVLKDDSMRSYWKGELQKALKAFIVGARMRRLRESMCSDSPEFFYVSPRSAIAPIRGGESFGDDLVCLLGLRHRDCLLVLFTFHIGNPEALSRPSWFTSGPRPGFCPCGRADNWGITRHLPTLSAGVEEALHKACPVPIDIEVVETGCVLHEHEPKAEAWRFLCDELVRLVSGMGAQETDALGRLMPGIP